MSMASWLRNMYNSSPDFIRQSVGRAASKLPDTWRYGPAFARAWRLLEASSTWSEAELAAHQLAQLRELLIFAGQHVPYYRRLFAHRGFRPERLGSVEEITQLPLLTRDMVRRLGRELLADNLPKSSYKYTMTAGTSGHPLSFYLTYDASAAEWAFMLHQWQQAGCRPNDLRLVIGSRVARGRERGRLWEYDPVNYLIRFSGYEMNPETLPLYVEIMQAYRPAFFHGFPSCATLLGQYLERSGQRLPSMRGLLLASENIYPGQREYLERVFECTSYTWYGQTEKSILASERAASRDYHLYPQYGVTELVDAEGQPVTQAGQRGQLVGTGFLNRASVLIRYLTDDDAEWATGPCACGCNSRRLRHVRGRWNQELLMGRSGSLFPAAHMIVRSAIFTKMSQFQFFQDTPGEATLRIVKAPDFTPDDEAAILAELAPKIQYELDMQVDYVSEIPPTPTGKFKFLEQRLTLDYPQW
jgi:phenylacetate-CoA ligase